MDQLAFTYIVSEITKQMLLPYTRTFSMTLNIVLLGGLDPCNKCLERIIEKCFFEA